MIKIFNSKLNDVEMNTISTSFFYNKIFGRYILKEKLLQ